MILSTPEMLQFYYQNQLAHGTVLNDTLFIHLRIDIVPNQNSIFDLYKIITYPVPIHGVNKQQKGYHMIQKIAPYLAVSRDNAKYRPLQMHQQTDCTNHFCKHLNIIYNKQEETCIWAIFTDNDALTHHLCTFHTYLHEDMMPEIMPISENEYLFINHQSSISLYCGDKKQFLEIAENSGIEAGGIEPFLGYYSFDMNSLRFIPM